MELEKVTKSRSRWYDDACGAALALEFMGERWAMLILRELMFGPRRFGEIRANLPGISANVLTQRLAGMEAAGLLVRRRLETSATVRVYELTPWGQAAAPALRELCRWALSSRRHDPTLFLSPASVMMSMQALFVPPPAAEAPRFTVALRFADDAFVARVADGRLDIARGVGPSDAIWFTDTTALVFTLYGKQPFDVAEAAGRLRIEGDRAAGERFVDCFRFPEKMAD